MKDGTLLKMALSGLLLYEIVTGHAGFGGGLRAKWFARDECPVVYWLLVAIHAAVLAGLMVHDWQTLGHP